jgi:predicted N-acyltransferase
MVDVVDRLEDVLDLGVTGGAALLTRQEAGELDRIERLREIDGLATRYVVAVDGGVAVGLLPLFPSPGEALAPNRIAEHYPGRADDLRRAGAVLLVGSDMAGASTFLVTGDSQDVAADMVSAASDVAGRMGAQFVCAPMLDDRQHSWVSSAAPWCGPPASEPSEAYLDLDFESFDAYVATLPSAWRAKRRRERRRFLESGLHLRTVPPAVMPADAAGLLAQVESKYGGASDRSHREIRTYLRTTAMAMGRDATALVAEQDGRLVAFSVLWDTGSGWRVRSWGCDYRASVIRESFAYFNLVVYEPLIRAVAAGVSRLVLGSGSLPAKVERGAAVRRLRSLCWEVPRS